MTRLIGARSLNLVVQLIEKYYNRIPEECFRDFVLLIFRFCYLSHEKLSHLSIATLEWLVQSTYSMLEAKLWSFILNETVEGIFKTKPDVYNILPSLDIEEAEPTETAADRLEWMIHCVCDVLGTCKYISMNGGGEQARRQRLDDCSHWHFCQRARAGSPY